MILSSSFPNPDWLSTHPFFPCEESTAGWYFYEIPLLHKTCDETTKEMIRQIFHEVMKQEDCTPETRRRIHMKMTKQEMWNKCEISAPFALHSSNCSQHSDATIRNRRTREGFGVRTKTLHHLATENCFKQQAQNGVKMSVVTVDFMKAFDSLSHQFSCETT